METPKVGERVYYEDMANPRRDGSVTHIEQTRWGIEYTVAMNDGEYVHSDMRQAGWKRVK
jgi:hypothetical protein